MHTPGILYDYVLPEYRIGRSDHGDAKCSYTIHTSDCWCLPVVSLTSLIQYDIMETTMREDDERCTCDETEYEYHSCPFQVEINDADPDEDHCDCCPYCTTQCAMEV